MASTYNAAIGQNVFHDSIRSGNICSTDETHQYHLKNDSIYKKGFKSIEKQIQKYIKDSITAIPESAQKSGQRVAIVYTIPIVVHVIHIGEPLGVGSNISDAQIQGAIAGLNDRFRNIIGNGVDVEIQFCLASRDPNGNPTTGINRVNGSGVTNYSSNGIGFGDICPSSANEIEIKNLSRWPLIDYYNIWVVKTICNNYGGYAYFPSNVSSPVDGAVIIHSDFIYNALTTAHEIAHGFNLFHTFTWDNWGTTCPENNDCAVDGDQCCDTPPHKSTDCGPTNPCTSLGIWDNSRKNYMSYCPFSASPINADRFTQDQKNRIRATLNVSPRSHLLNSLGCIAPPPPINDNCTAATLLSSTTICNYLTNQTVNNATASGKPKGLCDAYIGLPDLFDVWYYFQAQATSHTITVDPNGSLMDAVIVVYNTCTTNTEVGCSDTPGGNGIFSVLNLTGLTIGNNYYIRVYNYGLQTTNGGFRICVTHTCTIPDAVIVSGGGTFCNSAILTATGGSGGTIYFQGSTSNGTSTGTPSTSQTVTTSGTYYYRANNSCGWGTQGSVTVTLNTTPGAVSVSGGGTFCSSAILTATGGNGGTIYWQGSTSNGTSTATPSNSQTVTSSGTYYFRANNNCGWGIEGSVTVTIETPPVPLTVSGSGTYCNSAILTASGGNGSLIYWQGTDLNGTSFANPSSTQTVNSSGTYYFRTYNSCGWGPPSPANVTINSGPGAVTLLGGGTFCNSTILTATGGSGGTIYWQGSTSNGTSTGTPSTSQTVTTSGTYYFRANNNCGWGTQGSVTVTLNTTPGAVTVNGVGTFCSNAILTASGGSGGTIYWQGSTSNGTNTATPSNSQTVTSSGTYYFRANNNCGWGIEGSVTVVILNQPATPPNPLSNSPQCGAVTITRLGTPPVGETWYWQGASCGTRTDLGSGTTFNAPSTGTYYLRAYNNTGNCWSSSCGSVFVSVAGAAPNTPPDPISNSPQCGAVTITWTGTPPVGESWYWQGTSCGTDFSLGSGMSYNTPISGTYYIRAYNTASNCWSQNCGSISVIVTETPTTQADISSFTPANNSITISLAVGNGSKRVVKINTSNNFTAPPNGTDPSANIIYSGSGEQVVYNNTGNVFTVTGLSSGTNYCFRVYEANCNGASSLYNVTTAFNNPACQSTTFSCVAPTVTIHPANQNAIVTGGTNFNIIALGSNNVYQWQVSTNNGSTWTDITIAGSSPTYSGWATQTLNLSSTMAGNNNYQYRCYVSSTCTSSIVTSNTATLTVTSLPAPDLTNSQILSSSQIIAGGVIDEVIVVRNVGTIATTAPISFSVTNYSLLSGLTVSSNTNPSVTIGFTTFLLDNVNWTFDSVTGIFTSNAGVAILPGGARNIGVRIFRAVGANGSVSHTATISFGTGGGEIQIINNSISNNLLKN